MKGVSVSYGDIALGAKESFLADITDVTDFSDKTIFNKNGLSFANYVNPCEKYSVILDGSGISLPKEKNDVNLGIWSEQISGEDGYFENPIVLYLNSKEYYTSSGITLNFGDIFPSLVNVKWLRDTQIISDKTFEPNSSTYFFNNAVSHYNGLIFEFVKMSLPFNRLKMHSIEYGIGVVFYGEELTSANVIQAVNPISSQIEINTFDFTLKSKRNIEFSFQTQQPVSVYNNGILKAVCFVKSSTRKDKNIWSVSSEDYIGIMDGITYYGGVYDNVEAYDLLVDIFNIAKVPYSISDEFIGKKVSGHIPITTCREALMQVSFAIGAVVDTSNSDVVKVFSLSDEISQNISNNRILQGISRTDQKPVTSVELSVHEYIPTSEEISLYETSEIQNNIVIRFSQPVYGLTITNGEILNSGSNFAIINSSGGDCVLKGFLYNHVTSIRSKANPIVSLSDKENIVSVKNATLISSSNVDNILNLCYNYIVNKKEISLTIIDGKHIVEGTTIKYGTSKKYGTFKYAQDEPDMAVYDLETNVGDRIYINPPFVGEMVAIIERQNYSFVGGSVAKKTILR